ncbi:hypothetical protein BURKHO8Y_170429 [Burkholderia sp. 8Y]|nr:hypothetical protein BURKHO8Y_170429 [Burkholderia sp. 8Y]
MCGGGDRTQARRLFAAGGSVALASLVATNDECFADVRVICDRRGVVAP